MARRNPRPPTYRLLAATLAELGAFMLEVATSAVGIPGRIRFRMLRHADRATDLAKRAAEEPASNGENGKQ